MPRGGSAGGGKRGGVQFSRPQEPSFLRKIKEQVGYKDPKEDVNAKRIPNQDGLDHDQEEQDEEKPTVVVLNEGDLTAEEAENLNQKSEKELEESGPKDGRILFKKPVKRKPDDNNVENVTQDKCDIKSKKKKKEKPTNHNLLSFNDEEEDV